MIAALLHGKLSREQENMEDILTSSVFGVLRYVPAECGLLPFLRRSQAIDGQPGPALEAPVDVAVSYEFWPTLKEQGQLDDGHFECYSCEPDVLLKIIQADGRRLFVLIEAKFLSSKSSGASDDLEQPYDQLAREWDNLVCLAEREGAEPLLVYLTADFSIPADQILESEAEYLSKRPGGHFACRWLTWRQIPVVFGDSEDEALQDLVKLCERLNLRFFDRRVRFESAHDISWCFQPKELKFDWLYEAPCSYAWRYGA